MTASSSADAQGQSLIDQLRALSSDAAQAQAPAGRTGDGAGSGSEGDGASTGGLAAASASAGASGPHRRGGSSAASSSDLGAGSPLPSRDATQDQLNYIYEFLRRAYPGEAEKFREGWRDRVTPDIFVRNMPFRPSSAEQPGIDPRIVACTEVAVVESREHAEANGREQTSVRRFITELPPLLTAPSPHYLRMGRWARRSTQSACVPMRATGRRPCGSFSRSTRSSARSTRRCVAMRGRMTTRALREVAARRR